MKERRESSPLQVNGFLHTGATFPNKMPSTSRCHRPKLGEHVSVGFRKPLAQARAPMTTTPVPSIKDGNVTPFPTEVYSINTSHTPQKKRAAPTNGDTKHTQTHETTRAALPQGTRPWGTWQQPHPNSARSPHLRCATSATEATDVTLSHPHPGGAAWYSQRESNPHGHTASRF